MEAIVTSKIQYFNKMPIGQNDMKWKNEHKDSDVRTSNLKLTSSLTCLWSLRDAAPCDRHAAANASYRVSFDTPLWRLRLQWRKHCSLGVEITEILTLFPCLRTLHTVSPAPSRFTFKDFWSALSSILHQTHTLPVWASLRDDVIKYAPSVLSNNGLRRRMETTFAGI